MNYQHNIRSKLKKELRNDITQKELAQKLKISEPTLSRFLAGTRGITLKMAIKIADYYRLSLDELLGRKM